MSMNPTGEERFATPEERAIADAPFALEFSVTADDYVVVGVVTFAQALEALIAAKLAEGPLTTMEEAFADALHMQQPRD